MNNIANKTKLSRQFIQAISIIFAAWIISIGIIYIKAWVGPTSAPATEQGALAVDASGNVGIPTTDASYKLNVTGNVNATAYYGDGSNLTGITSGVAVRDTYRNLVIKNNTTNPAYQMDVDIDEIILQDTSINLLRAASVNLTIDITASGVNGLDTGTEASSTWYNIWVISNGSTTAGLFSTSDTSPTMPGGYTYKAYVGAVYNNGSFIILFQNNKIVIRDLITVVSGGTGANPGVSVDLSAIIPSTAKSMQGHWRNSAADQAYLIPDINNTQLGRIATYIPAAGWKVPYDVNIVVPQTVWYYRDSGSINIRTMGWSY